MLGKRLNIALFASHLEDDYAKTICKGAMLGAKQTDSNLFIIPGRYFDNDYKDEERTKCQYQYDTLFSYVNSHSIDVLIIMMETIGSTWSYQRKLDLITRFKDLTIINIGPEIEDYFYVKFDNRTGLREGIEHIIKKHKRKRIGFVSGPMTNKDAIERLQVYKDTLAANGMEVEEKLIEYGLYSDYSVDATERLIKKNPDLDAIIYSNDKMAMGGYEALEKNGIKIGIDISIMGFDDTKNAIALNPKLTTVRADAVEIGYRAVMCGTAIAKGEEPPSHIVDSRLMIRSSCGCAKSGAKDDSKNPMLSCRLGKLPEVLTDFTFEDSESIIPVGEYKSYVNNLFEIIINHIVAVDIKNEYIIDSDIIMLLDFLNENGIFEYISIDKFFYSFNTMMHYAEEHLDAYKNIENITALSEFMSNILCTMTTKFALEDTLHKHDLEYLSWMTNSLTRDMLSYVDDEEKSFGTVCEKFGELGIASSYIFTFGNPIIHQKDEVWIPPEKIYLKAYHDMKDVTVIPKNKQEIPTIDLFCNEYLPDRQFTMVISTLYSNTEQFGLMLSELEYEKFYYIAPITVQLCAAIKSMHLIQKQKIIQQQLNETLEKIKQNNIILDNISKSDELTGVYNRRGFFEMSQQMACDKRNIGKRAIVVFADMDCLKIINDKFGHEEGDYAIQTIANILSGSFRTTDIIGRIGGDEFAAFAIVDSDNNCIDNVRERIKAKSQYINETSGKPYYINMSTGICEFECSPSVNIREYLDVADERLYHEKRNKVKKIFREDNPNQ